MTEENGSKGSSYLVALIGGLLTNLFVAMLFAVAWNLGPASIGLPFLSIPQGVALFFCLFIAIFWPLYITAVVLNNLVRSQILEMQTIKLAGAVFRGSKETDVGDE